MKLTVWQCTDYCCARRPYSERWWLAATAPGQYEGYDTWKKALSHKPKNVLH